MTKREFKDNKKFNQRSAFGKSTVDIECPYCSEVVRAYVWSLAGGGKKCHCGALHTSTVTFAPLPQKSNN